MEYDQNNIFARILREEIPCVKVYETVHTLAFMDVMPMSPGHTLVIPKSPARNIFEADPDVLAILIQDVQHVARAAERAFDAEGVMIQQFNGQASGQSVFHLHFHIVPRWADVPLKRHADGDGMENPEVLKANAQKLRQVLDQMELATGRVDA